MATSSSHTGDRGSAAGAARAPPAAERNAALVALGQQIRKVRQARGISQESFALEAGISRAYYSGVERGERNVAALNLMRIAAALEVEVGELFPQTVSFAPLLDARLVGNSR